MKSLGAKKSSGPPPNFNEIRTILQAYSVVAAIYSACGNEVQCEKTYVKYIQLIEKYFNSDSLETSNAYYLVGVYYYEQEVAHKAVACFSKALAIRQKVFAKTPNEQRVMHPSCADCLLNLGILYKQRGYLANAELAL